MRKAILVFCLPSLRGQQVVQWHKYHLPKKISLVFLKKKKNLMPKTSSKKDFHNKTESAVKAPADFLTGQ